MDFNFDTGSIYGGIQNIDPTILPPLGGQAGVLVINGTGALTLPNGNTGQRPSPGVAAMLRYNDGGSGTLEYHDSTTWVTLATAAGAVSSFQTSLSGLTPSTATTGAVTLAGTLGVPSGGTGLTAITLNGVVFGNATSAAGVTAAGTQYQVLTAGATGIPAFDSINLASSVAVGSSVLPLANGGTNDALTASAGSIVYSSSTAMAMCSVGTSGYFLTSGGTGAPSWSNPATTLVTSFSLNDNSTTAIYTTSPTSATSGAVGSTITLNTQAANLVFAGPTTGSPAQPTFRALTLTDLGTALQLYTENPSTPTTPVATGTNAVAIGSGSTASAVGSFAEGDGTNASIWGSKAYANGMFATAGDAQHGVYILRNETTNATSTPLYLDGTSATQRLVVPNNSVWTFSIMVSARRTDATGGGAGYKFEGVVRKDTTSGSITFVGTPSKTILGETDALWDVTLTANTTDGDLRVSVTGQAAKTVRWVATVLTTETTN